MAITQDMRKDVFPNGLTIVTEAIPNVRSVSMGIWLRTGSRHEREAENGLSHFLEHMVFKGTTNRSAEEIARAAGSIGGHLDAFTGKEWTSFSIKVLDEHLPRAVDILADLVRNPLLQPDDIQKECQVIQEEIKMAEDAPDDLVHEIFTQSYWPDHPLGRPILGTRQTVSSFDRDRLFDYFHRYYTPGNMLVAAAGHLEHSRVLDLVLKALDGVAGAGLLADGHAPVPHPHIRYRRKKVLEQVHVCVGTPAYPHSHAKRYACYVLNTRNASRGSGDKRASPRRRGLARVPSSCGIECAGEGPERGHPRAALLPPRHRAPSGPGRALSSAPSVPLPPPACCRACSTDGNSQQAGPGRSC